MNQPAGAPRRLALVTGASRGIGATVATSLAGDHDLVLTARTSAALAEIAAAARDRGAHVLATIAADLGTPEGRAALVDEVAGMPIDVLVCNAGIAPSASLRRTDDATWASVMGINLEAPFRLCRALVPGMAERGFGRVVMIASTAALKGYRYTAAYAASKGGVLALARAIAAEYATRGVTVNAVCPGFVDTDIVRDAAARIGATTGRSEADARAELARFSPQHRLVTADEVAAMVVYWVSAAAAAVHGQALALDGGETTL